MFHCYANILKKKHSSLFLEAALSRNYSMTIIENKLINLHKQNEIKNQNEDKKNEPIKLTNLIIKTPYSSILWPLLNRKPQFHSLGDRVVHINPDSNHLRFGVTGTVIGLYKERIEVLLDYPVIGASNLSGRVPYFRGLILSFFDVFNLSKWVNNIFDKKCTVPVEECWNGKYDYEGLINQIKKE